MTTLSLFLFRLSLGLSLGMGLTSPRQVSSGFFRNHTYVILGLQTLGALAAASVSTTIMWLAIAGGLVGYGTSVLWLYERRFAGRIGLILVCVISLAEAILLQQLATARTSEPPWLGSLRVADTLTAGMVLGGCTAAMLLGHWYLNSPSMQLTPLFRLLGLLGGALCLRVALCIAAAVLAPWSELEAFLWLLIALRWSFGLIGLAVLVGMAALTLRVPNTQSATGILYVAVIAAFAGELCSLLLSATSPLLL